VPRGILDPFPESSLTGLAVAGIGFLFMSIISIHLIPNEVVSRVNRSQDWKRHITTLLLSP
jgi:hypothetical protein